MSYSFGMYFVPSENFEDALRKANRYTKILSAPEAAKSYLEDNKYYIPSLRYGKEATGITDNYWLYSLFNLGFVYWPKYHLLGMSGYSYPLADNVFPKHIDFQNSTDQDYDMETWNGLSQQIDDAVEKVLEMDAVSLNGILGYEDDLEGDLLYERQTCAYKTVFEMLGLDDWLYGKPSPIDDCGTPLFERFAMNVIVSQEMAYELSKQLKIIKRKETAD